MATNTYFTQGTTGEQDLHESLVTEQIKMFGKNVYYIQIGGAGLFYMGKNPLNLPVPEFNGEIQVEVRIGYAGDSSGSTSKAFTNKAGSKNIIEARRAELRCIGRMLTRSKSPYSLDNMNDVKKLFGAE